MKRVVRPLNDEYFLGLCSLYIQLNKIIDSNHKDSDAIGYLIHTMKNPGFMCFGLFLDDELDGFATGWKDSESVFYVCSLYLRTKIVNTKFFIDSCFEYLKSLGYEHIIGDVTTFDMLLLTKHYKAHQITAKFGLEL